MIGVKMSFIETGKKVNNDTGKNATQHQLKAFSTKELFWAIVKRHKFCIVSAYAVIITLFYLMPFLPSEAINIIFR